MMASLTVFVGCTKDNKENEKTYTLEYKLSNEGRIINPLTGEEIVKQLSPCFHFDISYVNSNGDTVKEHDITLPWQQSLTIKRPFHAWFSGSAYFNENELPDTVNFGKPYSLRIFGDGVAIDHENTDIVTVSKERFLSHYVGTSRMNFSCEHSFE